MRRYEAFIRKPNSHHRLRITLGPSLFFCLLRRTGGTLLITAEWKKVKWYFLFTFPRVLKNWAARLGRFLGCLRTHNVQEESLAASTVIHFLAMIGASVSLNSLKASTDPQISTTSQLPSGFAAPAREIRPFGADSPAALRSFHTPWYWAAVVPELRRQRPLAFIYSF